MPQSSGTRILGGTELWPCFIKSHHRARTRDLAIVIKTHSEIPGAFQVSFPAGTKFAEGEIEGTQGKYMVRVFRLPNGIYWGMRAPLRERPIRTLEPWPSKRQVEATRIVEGVDLSTKSS